MSVPADSPRTSASRADFGDVLASRGIAPLTRRRVTTVQVNVGRVCNQACHHCHVEAGPKRTETMSARTAARVLELVQASPEVEVLDITGGAPELNACFRDLVEGARRLGRRVIVRCNLTILYENGMEWLADFYCRNAVELICSLPCYSADNVDRQRGRGVFDKSISALQLLNGLGYGNDDNRLALDLVYNPLGAFLPPAQATLEERYREELGRLFGIRFRHLLTITNMPIKRFAEMLERSGEHARYMSLLVQHFNEQTVPGLMCRSMVSVGYEGSLHDCDFNQMLEMPLMRGALPQTLWTLASFDDLNDGAIATASHCFGCAAGAGSSCGGSLA